MAEIVNIEQLEAQAAEANQFKKRCQHLEGRCQDLEQENRGYLLGYCLLGAFLAGVLYALCLDHFFGE